MGIRQRKEAAGQPWVYDYKDPATGKRKLATPKSGLKRDAIALKKKIDAQIEAGTHIPLSDSAPVEKIAQSYLNYLEERKRDGRTSYSFLHGSRSAINIHLLPQLGKKRLEEVTLEDVLKLYNAMLNRGHIPSNARDNIRIFSRMEKFAIRRGYTKRQIFKLGLGELSGISKAPIKTFSLEDVRRLLAVSGQARGEGRSKQFPRTQAWLHLAVNLAAFCGLRWGEVFGLTVEAVDLNARVLRIRRSLQRENAAGHYSLAKGTKTPAGQRDIPMPAHIQALLLEWMRDHYVPNDAGLVFTLGARSRSGIKGKRPGLDAGQPIKSCNFHDHWKRLLIAAGLRDQEERGQGLHFHALRHFASALMIEHHIPLTDVAGLMGHKSFDLTLQVYAHSIVGGAKRHTAFENMAAAVNATNPQLLLPSH